MRLIMLFALLALLGGCCASSSNNDDLDTSRAGSLRAEWMD